MRRKRSRTEPAAAPEVTPTASPQDQGVPGTTLEDASFGEAARQALSAAEEIFREQSPIASSPPTNLTRDPLLSVDDFVVEHVSPSLLEDASQQPTPPAETSLRASPGSRHSAPIVIDDGKRYLLRES